MEDLIRNFLSNTDDSLTALSNKYEQHIANLPSWVLCNRKILIAQIKDAEFYIIRIIPDKTISSDEISSRTILPAEVNNFIIPWTFSPGIDFYKPPQNYFFEIADFEFGTLNNSHMYTKPQVSLHEMLIYTTKHQAHISLSEERAKKDSLDLWNKALNQLPRDGAFSQQVQTIIDRFELMIKRKNFVERKLHRYINSYANFLLPEHKKVFFEHALKLGKEEQVADFILQTNKGFPAILIELESSVHKVFKNKGELTTEAQHARFQISEWDRFISEDINNSQGEMNFLKGPRKRLVIIGRGLENYDDMIAHFANYTDTVIWTYDVLIKEAKDRINKRISEDAKLLNFANVELIN